MKAAFASVGRSISDGEASGMVGEAPGPVNFTQMVILFAEKMAGGKSLTSPNSTPIKRALAFSDVSAFSGFLIDQNWEMGEVVVNEQYCPEIN